MSGILTACGGGSSGSDPTTLQDDAPNTDNITPLALVGDWMSCINSSETSESFKRIFIFERFTFSERFITYASPGCSGRVKTNVIFDAGTYRVGAQTVDANGVPVWPIDYQINLFLGMNADIQEFGLVSVPVNDQIYFSGGSSNDNQASRPDSLNFRIVFDRQ